MLYGFSERFLFIVEKKTTGNTLNASCRVNISGNESAHKPVPEFYHEGQQRMAPSLIFPKDYMPSLD